MEITHPKRAIGFCELKTKKQPKKKKKPFPKNVINTTSLSKQLGILYLTHRIEKY